MTTAPALPLIDLRSLIEQRAPVRLIRRATTGGGEYWSSCPFCKSGTNRFHCWPHSARPHYWCRQCGASGDMIQFLKDYEGMSYVDACDELGIETDPEFQRYTVPESPYDTDSAPCKGWQGMAAALVEQAQKALWKTTDGRALLDYLRGRGIEDDLIEQQQLGYIPLAASGRWLDMPFSAWGLTEEQLTPEQWAKGCVRVPDGLLIPWQIGADLWKLTVKRPFAPANQLGYGQLLGSRECLYNGGLIHPHMPVCMTESVLDALSVQQVAGDLVAAVATDSAARTRGPRWVAAIASAPTVLQSFDADDAGEAGARVWCDWLPQAVRWTPTAHDTNDMLRAGQDIRAWVTMGVQTAQVQAEPLVQSGHVADAPVVPVPLAQVGQQGLVLAQLAPQPAQPAAPTLARDEWGPMERRGPVCRFCGPIVREVWSEIDQDRICPKCYSPMNGPVTMGAQPTERRGQEEHWAFVRDELTRRGYYEQFARDQARHQPRIEAYQRACLHPSRWTFHGAEEARRKLGT